MTRKQFDQRVTDMMTAAMDAGLWDDGHLDKARVALALRRQVANSPKLRECTPESLARAALDAHLAGLMPDGHEGYLVPRWNKKVKSHEAHFLASWRGLQSVACETGDFRSVTAEIVREGDAFRWTAGLTPTLEHEPKLNGEGPIIACYAIGFPKDGGPPLFAVADQADLQAARATGGPTWNTHPAAMSRKTAIRRLVDRVLHTPTTRSRIAAIAAADGRMDALGTADAAGGLHQTRAAQVGAAVLAPGPDEGEDEPVQPAVEAEPEPETDLDRINRRYRDMLENGMAGTEWADLQREADELGLVYNPQAKAYKEEA